MAENILVFYLNNYYIFWITASSLFCGCLLMAGRYSFTFCHSPHYSFTVYFGMWGDVTWKVKEVQKICCFPTTHWSFVTFSPFVGRGFQASILLLSPADTSLTTRNSLGSTIGCWWLGKETTNLCVKKHTIGPEFIMLCWGTGANTCFLIKDLYNFQ